MIDITRRTLIAGLGTSKRGHMICTVTLERWDTAFRVLDKVTVADRPIATRATLSVEHGVARIANS